MTKKKALYIVPTAQIGGAETFIKHTALYHKNIEPIYFLLNDGPLKKYLEQRKQRVYLGQTQPRLSCPVSVLKTVREIKKVIKAESISFIFSNMAYAAIFGGLLSKTTSIPHVWYQHGPASGWMDRVAGVLPHQTIFVNSWFTKETQERLEAPVKSLISKKRKIVRLQLGVATDEIEIDLVKAKKERLRILKELELPENTPLSAMLCRFQSWKGIHIFLEALRVANIKTKVAGVIWGGSHSPNESKGYESELRHFAKENQLPVVFAGPTENALQSLASVDAIINASIQPEPFGLSIIEGLVAGALPIVPNCGGPAEIITSKEIGMSYKMGDAAELAERLVRLTEMQPFKEEKRIFLSDFAKKEYSAQKTVESLEDYFE